MQLRNILKYGGLKLEKFKDILEDLIIESGINIYQISLKCGVSSTQIYKYLEGNIPTIDVAVRLSYYFKCTLDYLFGLSDIKFSKFGLEYDLSKFLSKYQRLLKDNNISHWKFAKANNFSESVYRTWNKGGKPSMGTLVIIAKELSSSIDYLIGRVPL